MFSYENLNLDEQELSKIGENFESKTNLRFLNNVFGLIKVIKNIINLL